MIVGGSGEMNGYQAGTWIEMKMSLIRVEHKLAVMAKPENGSVLS